MLVCSSCSMQLYSMHLILLIKVFCRFLRTLYKMLFVNRKFSISFLNIWVSFLLLLRCLPPSPPFLGVASLPCGSPKEESFHSSYDPNFGFFPHVPYSILEIPFHFIHLLSVLIMKDVNLSNIFVSFDMVMCPFLFVIFLCSINVR